MREPAAMPIAVMTLVSVPGLIRSEESPHAQPPAEAQVAQEFKAVAPELFKKWLEQRPEQLWTRGRGELDELACKDIVSGSMFVRDFVAFNECSDSSEPSAYQIDVKKTDSLLTPFLGLIILPVKMSCIIHGANVSAVTAKKSVARIAACVDAPYEECLAAGAKGFGGLATQICGAKGLRLETPFNYVGKLRLSYRWTEGGWEFQDQHEEPALNPSDTGSKKATD